MFRNHRPGLEFRKVKLFDAIRRNEGKHLGGFTDLKMTVIKSDKIGEEKLFCISRNGDMVL